jgi:hypothetical protein
MGVIEGNASVSDNDWETITRGGDPAIEKWINDQLDGKSCTIILVGQNTANRKWINYEISRSWELNKGIVGICIHNLKDKDENQSQKGNNPFSHLDLRGISLSDIIKLYDPPYNDSKDVYNYIQKNLTNWVEEGITIRNKY